MFVDKAPHTLDAVADAVSVMVGLHFPKQIKNCILLCVGVESVQQDKHLKRGSKNNNTL